MLGYNFTVKCFIDYSLCYAPYHHEHIIKHHLLLRVVNEGESCPVESAVEEVDPQPTAGLFYIVGASEESDPTPTQDQGKPRCI